MFEVNNDELKILTDFYIDLHKNPELSFQEKVTSKKMKKIVQLLGFKIIEGFGGYGFVGVFNNGNGPTIMLRTDMDALPIKELTELSYKSEVEAIDWFGNKVNVMHACGHDLHMTVFAGTLQKLIENKDKWSGTLIALCQPAEELGKGAKAMIVDGLFDKIPVPDYLLAYHDFPDLKSGEVGFTKGTAWAGCDSLDLTIYGEGGHGAVPQKAKDPIVLASQIVLALQTITSREVSPFNPVVLTVGSINGGSKHNIIPDKVEMKISLRTFDDTIRGQIIESIKRIAENTARATGIKDDRLPVLTGLENYHSPVINNSELAEKFARSSVEILGGDKVFEVPPVSVSEDFDIFRQAHPKIKSAIFWLGVDNKQEVKLPKELEGKTPPLHSPYLAPDPEIPIQTGVKAMANAIVNLFSEGK